MVCVPTASRHPTDLSAGSTALDGTSRTPPWKRKGPAKAEQWCGGLVPLLRTVLVQPSQGERRCQEPITQLAISPELGWLGAGYRTGSETAIPAPPPLPEPIRVDRELVLKEVIQSEQGPVTERKVTQTTEPEPPGGKRKEVPSAGERARLLALFQQLLQEIYPGRGEEPPLTRRASEASRPTGGEPKTRVSRHHSDCGYHETRHHEYLDYPIPEDLSSRSEGELLRMSKILEGRLAKAGSSLVSGLEERDRLLTEHEGLCDLLTACLHAISDKTSEDSEVRFSVASTDSGFNEWAKAMKMVARLPDGIPAHFRKTLWLSLAERHLASRNISWPQVERSLFSDRLNPGDQELSVQIVKDLHRTGCSLFCGSSGQQNQAVLKRVLLAYARWNKEVGYCQGLNMLAALILQVMQGCQGATVKVMIYLIEGVLPDSYFAENLRGLSVDMAVFRDLLGLKMPHLAAHLDSLQLQAKESGTSYEPPLMDVFTMQWFLTIFCNCLPQSTVLRLWDLLLLEGNTVLLKAALVVCNNLSERMMSVESADEFYSIMAVLTREMLEFGMMDANGIIKAMDVLSIPELGELRERYVYNISPWPVSAKKGFRIFYPQQGPEETVREPRMTPISNHPDREKIALDIGGLKKQYWKLRERQRQAHIILSAACRQESYAGQSSPALNHLLLGKSALKSVRARGRRPEGPRHAEPPPRKVPEIPPEGGSPGVESALREEPERGKPFHRQRLASSSSSSSTELCDSSGDSEAEECPPSPGVPDSPPPAAGLPSPLPSRPASPPAQTSPPSQGSSPGQTSPPGEEAASRLVDEAVRKRDELMRILKENSEMLGRLRHHSTSPEAAPSRPRHSPEEPDDIKDIRRRYSFAGT